MQHTVNCGLTKRFDTVDKLDQKYLFVPSSVRDVYLAHLLQKDMADKTVILFVSKCRNCELLRIMLKELGIRSTALYVFYIILFNSRHSQMSQSDRIGSIAKFKSRIVPILISTDVGSRGLDIPQVQVVINYDLPADGK